MRPGIGAAWGTPFYPSGLRSLASFAPRSSSFQNNDPRKFIAQYDVVKVLKQIKKEIGVFCLRRINSIKGEIIIDYQKSLNNSNIPLI